MKYTLNRTIVTIAIIVAFVGGMFFVGVPVEAKKGGGGSVIDEVLAAIMGLDTRVSELESSVTLDSLECSTNQIAKYNGENWVCDSDEVSGPPIESFEIEGYDARDVAQLTMHDGILSGVTDGAANNAIDAEERIAIYVENQSAQKITLEEVRVGGTEYFYTQSATLPSNSASASSYWIVDRGVVGNPAVTTDTIVGELEAGQEVTFVVDLVGGILLCNDAQVVITTDNGAILNGAIIAGRHSDEVSDPLIESFEIEGYDARDVVQLTMHDGIFSGVADGTTNNAIDAEERIAIYVQNNSAQKITLEEVRVEGSKYFYNQTSTLPVNGADAGAYFIVDRGIVGNPAVTTNSLVGEIGAGQRVTIIVDLIGGILLGNEAQVMITTTCGTILNGVIIAGQQG